MKLEMLGLEIDPKDFVSELSPEERELYDVDIRTLRAMDVLPYDSQLEAGLKNPKGIVRCVRVTRQGRGFYYRVEDRVVDYDGRFLRMFGMDGWDSDELGQVKPSS